MKLLKKGQVGGLQGFILAIVTVAIVLAIGLIVLSELQETSKELGTVSAVNESVTLSGSGSLANGTLSQANLLIGASACRNVSATETADVIDITLGSIGSANCSVSSLGRVTVDVSQVNTSNIKVDYTLFDPSAAFNSSGSIITKMATIPTWIGIIIIIALAFIVLSFFISKRQ